MRDVFGSLRSSTRIQRKTSEKMVQHGAQGGNRTIPTGEHSKPSGWVFVEGQRSGFVLIRALGFLFLAYTWVLHAAGRKKTKNTEHERGSFYGNTEHERRSFVHAHTHAYTHAHTQTRTHTLTYTQTQTHTYTHKHPHTSTHTQAHTHTHAHT